MAETHDTADGIFHDGVYAIDHHVTLTFKQDSVILNAPTFTEPVEWGYADMRRVADLATDKGMSFRVKDGPGRLNVQNTTAATEIRKRARNLKKSDMTGVIWRRLGLWGAGAVASVVLILFVIIPSIADQLATVIPVKQEIALGRATIKHIEALVAGRGKDLTCKGVKGQVALKKMTARLSEHFENPYDLNVRVFNHKMVNAFAVPGGHIILFDGLIQNADSPEEVAAVLAHEIGHVINRDPTRLSLRSAGSVGILGLLFGDFAGGGAALVIANRLLDANYSQDAETNADTFAHQLMARAELPSTPMATFFEKLRDEYGDESKFISHISSHPQLSARATAAKTADTIGDKTFEPVLTSSEWSDLKAICKKPEPPKEE